MQKLAVIDCGTNTFHLLVATISETVFTVEYKKQFAVKLGEGGINQKQIQPEAFKRGVDALIFFSQKLKELNVNYLKAFATSATRSAQNGLEFEREVYEKTGIRLSVIDGNREAQLIFKGVQQAYPMTDENVLVMDIGGGSVEFTVGNKNSMQWFGSFDIGAARLVEKFHRTEPISPADVMVLNTHLDEQLAPLAAAMQQYKVTKLVGSAGSFDSISELVNDRFGTTLFENNETWDEIPIEYYQQIHTQLLTSTYEDRLQMAGLADYRVEMMVVSSCLMHYVLSRFELQKMYCSAYALKEGALYEMLEKMK